MMKKVTIQIAALALALLLICAACRLATRNTYVARVPIDRAGLGDKDIRLTGDSPDVVRHDAPEVRDGMVRISIHPQRPGEAFIDVNDAAGNDLGELRVRVSRLGTVYDPATGGVTGDAVALTAFTAFCLLVAAIMYRAYRSMRGPAFYAYGTIYTAGFSLFALLTGLTMLVITVRHISRPHEYSMLAAYDAITTASWRFMMLTAPLVEVFALAMAVSNAALLRHEGFSLKNVLGIGVALSLVLGEALAHFLYSRSVPGPIWRMRLWNTLCNVYATGFAWFECMLVGVVICGVRAARHIPGLDADYILILGCKFRSDGTLSPLLRGRVDKALEFWHRQRAQTGKEAVLIPSGGQGADEPISEAEAMRRYIDARGIPADRVLVEDQSRNTYQNMVFSKALIGPSGGKVVYATTNYHVFRSGVWANLAGLPAEGVGSRTRWWYWPNAFMREWAGLMFNRVPQALMLLASMLIFFGALSMTLG